ncbi:EpsG-like putative glucosyltransferase [Anaerospora hongkongensis]|uniref:EpsG-like putative glucosyltransferase n=1 Tax=Anaerospora hongkongensis TaxID=244830 RepID=A0A4R1PWN3_9FIRM|nr:EpsG family protein [Anaerospora hongkongensis]TCL36068.1 EpsG-like putative glucosyltransferase [Anaerospora hongkongensis]
MFIYEIVGFYTITCLLSIYNCFEKNLLIKNIFVLLLLSLILIAGMREPTIDSDFTNYVQVFETAPTLSSFDFDIYNSIEVGYLFLNAFLKWVFDDYRVIFILMAFLHLSIYGYIFIRSSPFPILSLLVLVSTNFLFEMAQLRQGTVCSLMLLAGYYISQRQNNKFLLTIAVGCLFHYTMLLGLVLYPLTLIHWSKKKVFLVAAICLLFLQINWLNNFMELLPNDWTLTIRLLNYADSINQAPEANRIVGDLKTIVLLIIFSMLRPVTKNQEKYCNVLMTMFVFATVIRSGFHEYITFATRLSEPLFPSQYILIPMLLYTRMNKYITIALIMVLCIIFFIKGLHEPFLFIFESE